MIQIAILSLSLFFEGGTRDWTNGCLTKLYPQPFIFYFEVVTKLPRMDSNFLPLSPKCWDDRQIPPGPDSKSYSKWIRITDVKFNTGNSRVLKCIFCTFSLYISKEKYWPLMPMKPGTIKVSYKLEMVVHTGNPSTLETEAGTL